MGEAAKVADEKGKDVVGSVVSGGSATLVGSNYCVDSVVCVGSDDCVGSTGGKRTAGKGAELAIPESERLDEDGS